MTYGIKIDDELKKVTGIEKLANYVEKMLLTTVSSDEDYPNQGTYLKSIIGSNIDDLEETANKIMREFDRVESQIKEHQIKSDYFIPQAERLDSLELIKLNYTESGLQVDYKVVNKEDEEVERELFSDQIKE